MLLYLVRHAIAVDRSTPGLADDERPLTEKGSRRMAEIVRGLDALGVTLGAVWTSPLQRASQTAEILVTLKGMAKNSSTSPSASRPIERVPQLAPGGDTRELISRIQSADNVDTLALVGHEPDLSEFAGRLLAGKAVSPILLKKGAVACIKVELGRAPPDATLQWLLQPRALRRLANG